MPLSEFELKRCEAAISRFLENRRPPINIRDQLDLGYRIQGQSVELFEIRPVWNNPKEKMESPFAKATYVKTRKNWKVFWRRADLRWHQYDPDPIVDSIEEFLTIVEKDEYCCFFG
jgi:hypothetical protein